MAPVEAASLKKSLYATLTPFKQCTKVIVIQLAKGNFSNFRYNLTVDIIQSIFKTYPAVKRKHSENVPSKMTEQEFWTKFFQSHYFHRDRLHGKGVKDIFTECAKDDDKRIKEQIRAGVADPVANVHNLNDKTIDDSFGANESQPTTNIVHQSIIKRFNQHSIMVMNAGKDRMGSGNAQELPVGEKPDKTKEPVLTEEEQRKNVENKRKRLKDMTEFEDLETVPTKKTASLTLAKSRYHMFAHFFSLRQIFCKPERGPTNSNVKGVIKSYLFHKHVKAHLH